MCEVGLIITQETVLCRLIGRRQIVVCLPTEFVQDHREETLRIIKRMTSIQDFQKTKITVSDICQKGKTRIANIADEKGKPIKIVLSKDCLLKAPWNVSSYDGGTRCSLDIIMNEDLHNLVTRIDTRFFNWVCQDSTR